MWLMPLRDRYGTWPSSGEIDIVESRGNNQTYVSEDGKQLGCTRFSSCFHFGPAWNKDGYDVAVNDSLIKDFMHTSYADEFHTFGLYWDDKELYTYVDHPDNVVARVIEYGKVSFWDMGIDKGSWNASDSYNVYENSATIRAPFDQEMYIIMNVAIGGTSTATSLPTGYFPDEIGNKPWKTSDAYPANRFIQAKDQWYPTWTGKSQDDVVSDDAALQIDSVNVWGFSGLSTYTLGKNPEHALPALSSNNSKNEVLMEKKENEREVLILEENFHSFDLNLWKHDISMTSDRPNQFQTFVNSRRNSYVKNGSLYLKPTWIKSNSSMLDIWGSTPASLCTGNRNSGCIRTKTINTTSSDAILYSASINTATSFSFTYGRIEFTTRLPKKGKWLRPVFRLLPLDNEYGECPQSGEITVMEGRVLSGDNQTTTYSVRSGIQVGLSNPEELNSEQRPFMSNLSFESTELNTFGLYWSKESLFTYFNDPVRLISKVEEYGQLDFYQIGVNRNLWSGAFLSQPWRGGSIRAPFDTRMYISIGLGVGGTDGFFLPDEPPLLYSPLSSSSNMESFQLSTVKVWALPESRWTFKSDVSAKRKWELEHTEDIVSRNLSVDESIFYDTFNTFNFSHWKPVISASSIDDIELAMFVNSRRTSLVRNKTLILKPIFTSDVMGEKSVYNGFLDMWGTDVASRCTSPQNSGCRVQATGSKHMLNPIQSTYLRTAETFSIVYGRFEIQAKFPTGQFIQPIIKLKSMEEFYTATMSNTPLDLDFVPLHVIQRVSDGTFHTFGLYWRRNNRIDFYLDHPSNIISTHNTTSVYDQEMYLVLGLSVAMDSNNKTTPREEFLLSKDQWFSSWTSPSNMNTIDEEKTSLQIKSVMIWPLNETYYSYHRLAGDCDVLTDSSELRLEKDNQTIVSIVQARIVMLHNKTLDIKDQSTVYRLRKAFREYLVALFQCPDDTHLKLQSIQIKDSVIESTSIQSSACKHATMKNSIPSSSDEFRFDILDIAQPQNEQQFTDHFHMMTWMILAFGALVCGTVIASTMKRQRRRDYVQLV